MYVRRSRALVSVHASVTQVQIKLYPVATLYYVTLFFTSTVHISSASKGEIYVKYYHLYKSLDLLN